MAEEEPLNVQVARALGCSPRWEAVFDRLNPGGGGAWLCECSDRRHAESWSERGQLRGYLHDKAWLWDVLTLDQRIRVTRTVKGRYVVFSRHPWVIQSAETLAEAVCRWVIAAKRAGIEVRQ